MSWPIEAILIVAALGGCWVACAAAQVAWVQRNWALAGLAGAVLVSLFSEVAALNGPTVGGSLGGLGVVSMLTGGLGLTAFAIYLLTPPGEDREEPWAPGLSGPAANPDSEA